MSKNKVFNTRKYFFTLGLTLLAVLFLLYYSNTPLFLLIGFAIVFPYLAARDTVPSGTKNSGDMKNAGAFVAGAAAASLLHDNDLLLQQEMQQQMMEHEMMQQQFMMEEHERIDQQFMEDTFQEVEKELQEASSMNDGMF